MSLSTGLGAELARLGAALVPLWAGAALAMAWGWRWQQRRANAGIVDVLWSACLAAGAVVLAWRGAGAPANRWALALLGGAWGLRLALYLWARVRHEAEDGRYRQLRAHWHGDARKFFLFFQFQALLVPLFALPFAVVAGNARVHPAAYAVAVVVWAASVAGEASADRQLARFRADPANRGRTCRQGWWRYSRHPNYFFEWLHWFTYVALAVGAAHGWLALSGPVVMYVFLRWVSGIPFTEAQALRTRGEDYRDYQRRTPLLIPWFPKEST